MEALAVGGLIMSFAQAGQIRAAGDAKAQGYEQQAQMAVLRGRQEALKHKQQGVQVLDRMLRTNSTLIARGALGGNDPTTGSPATVAQGNIKVGANSFYMSKDNAITSRLMGEYQGSIYRQAAQQARSSARSQAFGAIASGFTNVAMMGIAPKLNLGSLFGGSSNIVGAPLSTGYQANPSMLG